MNAVPAFAAGYVIFLALIATLLLRRRTPRAGTTEWSQVATTKLRGAIACTLFVLAAFILIVTAVRHRRELRSVEVLGAAALAVGALAAKVMPSAVAGWSRDG